MAIRSTNVNHSVEGKTVFATPTGLKLGARGKVQTAEKLLGQLDKGQARKLRKALRSIGHPAAAAPRKVA